MININYGRNKELMEACKPLFEYAWLIEKIRDYGKDADIETAVDKALDDMSEDFEIKPFLIANKAEVKQMCLTEYNETETMEMFREEGRAEGRAEGRVEGRAEGRVEGRAEGEKKGEDKLAKLIITLNEEGEAGLVTKALQDLQVRKELYKKYNIS